MKQNNKLIGMDYRHQSAKTYGIFATAHWPRDDETTLSNIHRLDGRLNIRQRSLSGGPIGTNDPGEMNYGFIPEGRRLR